MRGLKFRAWDKWKNTMIQPNDGDFIGWHAMSNWRECLEVMQFTGLTDANGVEIYEGDIVSSNAIVKPGAEVVYLESYACFSVGVDWPINEYKGMHYPEPLVVVGNIHQNPELLSNP